MTESLFAVLEKEYSRICGISVLCIMAMPWWWTQKISVFTFRQEYGNHLKKFELERSHGYNPAKLAFHRTGTHFIHVVNADTKIHITQIHQIHFAGLLPF